MYSSPEVSRAFATDKRRQKILVGHVQRITTLRGSGDTAYQLLALVAAADCWCSPCRASGDTSLESSGVRRLDFESESTHELHAMPVYRLRTLSK